MNTPRPPARPRRKPTSNPAKRYSAVIRVSRKNDRGGDSFMSPEQQKDALRAWAVAHNAELVGPLGSPEPFHDETDSVSGKTTDREGLRAAMDQALTGETDGVIVARVDRFSRSLIEGLLAVHRLTEEGKGFVAVVDGIDSGQGGRSQRLLLVLLLMFAEWHLESLTEGWVSARQRHIGNGVANVWPYGYRRIEDEDAANHRRLVPEPDEAKVVRRIFQRRAAGKSWIAIADELNDADIAPPRPRKPVKADGTLKPRAEKWTYTRVMAIVANRAYLGELRSGPDIVNLTAHKALVPIELWERAHNVQKTPQRRHAPVTGEAGFAYPKRDRRAYLLAGIARCCTCGGRMVGQTHKVPPSKAHPDGKDSYYYRCRVRYGWGSCPRPARVNAQELDDLVIEAFENEWVYPTASKVDTAPPVEVQEAEADLHDARADLRLFVNSAASNRTARTMGQAWYDEALGAKNAAVERALEAVEVARGASIGLALPGNLKKTWPKMKVEEKRTLLANAIELVAVQAPPKNQRVPAADRSRLWWRGETDAPQGLPGREGSAQFRPIDITA